MDFGKALGGVGTAVGTAIGGPGVGATLGALGGAAGSMIGGGGQSSSSGYTLPPEYELQYFQQFQQNMGQLQSSYQQVSQLANIYNQRVQLSVGAQKGDYSSQEALGMLNSNNIQLAQSLGMSAQDLASNGFIDKNSAKDLESYQQAAQGKLEDPALVQQQKDQRRQLQQDLSRQGVPAAQQAIALQQFDVQARQQTFQNSLQMGQGILGGLQARQSVQAQGFNQAVGSLQAGQGQIQANQQGQLGLMQAQQGLRQEANQNFTNMGQFKFSDAAQAALQTGLAGPGSFYNQTGVSQGALGDYRNWVQTQQRVNFTGQGQNGYNVGNQQMDPNAYQQFKAYQGNQNQANQNALANQQGPAQQGGSGLALNKAYAQYT